MNPKRLLISTTIAAFLLMPALRAAETKSPPINPALLYWQAAAQLPKLSDQQETELRDMASGKQPADSAKIEGFGFGRAEKFLRRAAASPAPCDWGLVLEDGPAMAMPHLSKIREMANIAVAQGDALLREGKTAEGLDTLLMAHRMARHAGVGGTLISYLVQVAIETTALQAAARHCLGWDEATRHGYAVKLQALPPLRSLQEGYHGELLLADWIDGLAQLGEAERFEKARAVLWMAEGDSKSPADQKAESEKLRTALESGKAEQGVEAYRGFHKRAEAAMGKPWKEGNGELMAIDDEVQRSDYFRKGVLPCDQKLVSTNKPRSPPTAPCWIWPCNTARSLTRPWPPQRTTPLKVSRCISRRRPMARSASWPPRRPPRPKRSN